MLSEEQIQEKLENVRICVEAFLGEKDENGIFNSNNKTIYDVERETKIPHSSVQRYLHAYNYIKKLFPDDYVLRIAIIESRLDKNKVEGNRKGGVNFAINNEATKDENGQFTGSKKR